MLGDDSGEVTLEEVEEEFSGLEGVRGFVNAVRAQSEAIMTAAVQQGSHTAHPAWSLLSDRLTHTPTHIKPTLPEWNRLYVANSLHLRPYCLLYEQNGTARLMFACGYRDNNSLGQLKDNNRLRTYVSELSHCTVTDLTDAQQLQLLLDSTEQTAQHTEPRHLYEPLIGALSEWQVIPGATPTAPPARATKVSAYPARTAHANMNARDRYPASSAPNPVSSVDSYLQQPSALIELTLVASRRELRYYYYLVECVVSVGPKLGLDWLRVLLSDWLVDYDIVFAGDSEDTNSL